VGSDKHVTVGNEGGGVDGGVGEEGVGVGGGPCGGGGGSHIGLGIHGHP